MIVRYQHQLAQLQHERDSLLSQIRDLKLAIGHKEIAIAMLRRDIELAEAYADEIRDRPGEDD